MKLVFISLWWLISCPQNVISQSSLQKEFVEILSPLFKPKEPGGVVMVAKQGEVIYQKAFAMANLELNVPANDSMIFCIGSNTKQFTAVAILQLVEEGKLRLEDTLGKFISSIPQPFGGVTMQQLLSQTSGIVSNNEADIKKLMAGEKLIKPIAADFAPGTKWEYNNTNYSILGHVIEKITGIPYATYITEHIFRPAGMVNSSIDNELSIVRNRAPGYRNVRGRFQNSRPSGRIGASGGIQSTVQDLLKWNTALKAGTLLKQETLQQAFTPQKLRDGNVTTYGFGWHLETLQGSPTRRHGGMVPGYTSETLYLPQEDVYIVILTNTELSPFPITAIARVLAALAIGKPYVFKETFIDQKELAKFVGLYKNEHDELVNITERPGGLIFQRPNGGQNKLYYAGNNEFFFERDFFRVKFVSDQAGKVTSLQTSKVDLQRTDWARTNKPLLKLSPERIADSLVKQYEGKYFLQGNDTLMITRDAFNLYLKKGSQELLLAATDNTHFFAVKNDLNIIFTHDPVTGFRGLLLIQDKKIKRYVKL
jgi:CubicO group peptidase (beta-lactamase class C family)